MKIFSCLIICCVLYASLFAQQTPFEKSNGIESATYFQAIDFYKKLDKSSLKILVKEMGPTDAGYPLHLVLISNDAKFDPAEWHKQNKVVVLINNGIHPGEPDGIDASMLLARDLLKNKVLLPANVALAFIPVYNIGGCLNRNSFSRVNQNGPVEYGFRGNSQNLDLNRDFTKCDSKEARSFTHIFQYLNPDILIDNHVSDGADYQHTITLITTLSDKLGGNLGKWVKKIFEPSLYIGMRKKGWEMIPYLEFENADIGKGIKQFYDAPRYSSGYAALFETIGFMPETHMLKAYKDRVRATYDLMQTFIEQASLHAVELTQERKKAIAGNITSKDFPLTWINDSANYSTLTFKGYEQAYKTSEATGLERMFFDHTKPFTRPLKFYDVYKPFAIVNKPKAYIIPQGWHLAIELLKLNGVVMHRLFKDSLITVDAYHIDDYKSYPFSYEKHHKNYNVTVSVSLQKIKFLKGDYVITLNQVANRYIVEMLEPTGEDSFFAWNFFDAILQQKEGYSNYRWEDVAAAYLKSHPQISQELEEKKSADSSFRINGSLQLNFIYKNSPYYEPAHLRYPIYRVTL